MVQVNSDLQDDGDDDRCTCKNSKCLKKYCVCFKASRICDADKCKCPLGTCNNRSEEARESVLKTRHNRKRQYEQLSLPSSLTGEQDDRCTCQKSKCVKKYCVCYKANRICDANKCKCPLQTCNNRSKEARESATKEKDRKKVLQTQNRRNRGNLLFLPFAPPRAVTPPAVAAPAVAPPAVAPLAVAPLAVAPPLQRHDIMPLELEDGSVLFLNGETHISTRHPKIHSGFSPNWTLMALSNHPIIETNTDWDESAWCEYV